MSTQQADIWQTRRLEDIQIIQAALLDLIDIGPADRPVQSRQPTRWEKDHTWRAADDYQPTAKGASRQSGRSDPTGNAATAWEAHVQQATTQLSRLVSALVKLLPDVQAPDELPTRTVPATYTQPARVVVDVAPARCRRHVIDVCDWLTQIVSQVADGWREGWAGDAVLRDRVEHVEALLAGLRRRIAPERPRQRWCACGCGEPAPPRGEGATRPACRKRMQRERERESA